MQSSPTITAFNCMRRRTHQKSFGPSTMASTSPYSALPAHGASGWQQRLQKRRSDRRHSHQSGCSTLTPMRNADVLISEVGPRDGLQSVAATMPTAAKFEWIDALHAAGVREIEVASFVPAKLLPQMADAADVVRHAA